MQVSDQEIVRAVVKQYMESGDFNGLPAYTATDLLQIDLAQLRTVLTPLVAAGRLSVLFGDIHPNPHIRAFRDEPIEQQIAKLAATDNDRFVIYPTPATLEPEVDVQSYAGRPFTLRLALGAPQLEFASFELPVLEFYRRDPRYHFWCNDIQGTISIGDAAYESDEFPEKHKVLLQSFGFSYNDQFERAVAVFFTDLGGLTPEHQQIWAAHEHQTKFRLHPDFYRAQILGDWSTRASLTDAFVEELRTVNAMVALIGWEPLFRKDFSDKPKEFALLLRSTQRELNDFILLLDKMMSDNINVDFFPGTIARTTETCRADGAIIVQQRGSIAMLEEWLNTLVSTADLDPMNELIATFREVRKLRQQPAHVVDEDTHDPTLFKQQRDILLKAYDAVRTLRLLLANHPKTRPAQDEMDEHVRKGEIWTM